jgi:hypothetical protein
MSYLLHPVTELRTRKQVWGVEFMVKSTSCVDQGFANAISGSTARTNNIPTTIPMFSMYCYRRPHTEKRCDIDWRQKTKMSVGKCGRHWRDFNGYNHIFDFAQLNATQNGTPRCRLMSENKNGSNNTGNTCDLKLNQTPDVVVVWGIWMCDIDNMHIVVGTASIVCRRPKFYPLPVCWPLS